MSCRASGQLSPATAAAAEAAFLAACEAGDVAAVEEALRGGVHAGHQEVEHGRSGLMLAAGGGHLDTVALLLGRGAPWNALDRQGRSAGDYAVVRRTTPPLDA